MQRVNAIVSYDVSSNVVEELKKIGVGGIILVDSRGQGEGERPEIKRKKVE